MTWKNTKKEIVRKLREGFLLRTFRILRDGTVGKRNTQRWNSREKEYSEMEQ